MPEVWDEPGYPKVAPRVHSGGERKRFSTPSCKNRASAPSPEVMKHHVHSHVGSNAGHAVHEHKAEACKHGDEEKSCCHHNGGHAEVKPAAAAKYYCPMCEGVVSDKPGDCPKCGMAL